MTRLAWAGLCLLTLLAACNPPAGASTSRGSGSAADLTNAPLVERSSPVRWNAATNGFELNGKPIKALKLWTFDGSTDGFTSVGGQVIPAQGSGLSVVVADQTLRSPKGLNVPGGQYPLVLVRLTRTHIGGPWDGGLFYATSSHPESATFFSRPLFGADPKVGETTVLVYDMSRQDAGAPDWAQSTIDQIRFDLEDRPGGAFLIRQIAIAQDPDPAAFAPASPTPTAGGAAPRNPKS